MRIRPKGNDQVHFQRKKKKEKKDKNNFNSQPQARELYFLNDIICDIRMVINYSEKNWVYSYFSSFLI